MLHAGALAASDDVTRHRIRCATALCVTFAWLRRYARQLRRAALSSGLQVRAHGPQSPPPDLEPNLVVKPPHDWIDCCTQHLRSRTAAMRAGHALERPPHTPTLRRALRHWRRDVTSRRDSRGQRYAWRLAATVLDAARSLDRQQGALCRLAAWCRSQRVGLPENEVEVAQPRRVCAFFW